MTPEGDRILELLRRDFGVPDNAARVTVVLSPGDVSVSVDLAPLMDYADATRFADDRPRYVPRQ